MKSRSKNWVYLKDFPKPLLDAIVRGGVVPFIGAGFSKNCNGPEGFTMPNWNQLGKLVASELPNYEYLGNPIEALSSYEYKYKRVPLIEFMKKIFRLNEVLPGNAHKLLAECFGGIICTTNFDTLLEDAFKSLKIGCVPVIAEDSLPIANPGEVSIIKVHGDFYHPDHMVITEDDYDLFIEKNPLLCTYISSLFITKTILLIGYSLDDSDLRQLLKIVHNRLGRLSRPTYCIQVDADDHTLERFRRRGIDVINIPNPARKSYTQVFTDLFEELKTYKIQEDDRLTSSSSPRSKEQMILPRGDNKLCFVDCSINKAAVLKEMLTPTIISAGAVPMWPEDVVANDGMDYRSAIEAVIRKSSVRIFDVSDMNKMLASELQIALRHDIRRTILIEDDQGQPHFTNDTDGCVRLQYSLRWYNNSVEVSPNEAFLKNLGETIRSCWGSQGDALLRNAERLYEMGDYDASVISAWIDVEGTLAKVDGPPWMINTRVWEKIRYMFKRKDDGNDDVFRMRRLRNEVVHAVRHASKKDAEFALQFAKEVILMYEHQ